MALYIDLILAMEMVAVMMNGRKSIGNAPNYCSERGKRYGDDRKKSRRNTAAAVWYSTTCAAIPTFLISNNSNNNKECEICKRDDAGILARLRAREKSVCIWVSAAAEHREYSVVVRARAR